MIAGAAHGGTILIVPRDDASWEASLAFAHRFVEPDLAIGNIIRRDLEDMNREGKVLKTVSEAPLSDAEKNAILGGFPGSRTVDMSALVESVASLAAVDGAVDYQCCCSSG